MFQKKEIIGQVYEFLWVFSMSFGIWGRNWSLFSSRQCSNPWKHHCLQLPHLYLWCSVEFENLVSLPQRRHLVIGLILCLTCFRLSLVSSRTHVLESIPCQIACHYGVEALAAVPVVPVWFLHSRVWVLNSHSKLGVRNGRMQLLLDWLLLKEWG